MDSNDDLMILNSNDDLMILKVVRVIVSMIWLKLNTLSWEMKNHSKIF